MGQRIAISGSAGVGKSTLAAALAGKLGLPYIPEGMREYLVSGAPGLHALSRAGLRDLLLRLWSERLEREAAAPNGFVADRSSYDFAAFWLFYGFAEAEDPVTDAYLRAAMDPARYDIVALLPFGVIPLVDDGVRSTNPWRQLHTHLLIEGMVARCALRTCSIAAQSVDARVDELLGVLAGRVRLD